MHQQQSSNYRTLQVVPNDQWIDDHCKNYQFLCFDMDGTLLNTEYIHALSLYHVLRSQQVSDYTVEQLERMYKGKADQQAYQDLEKRSIISMSWEHFLQKKNMICTQLIHFCETHSLMIMDLALVKMIKYIKSQSKTIALVTASERQVMHTCLSYMLRVHNITFDLVLSRNDTPQTKPHPLPYIYAMNSMNYSASDTLIFEDSLTGLKSAQDSGAHVLKVMWYLDLDKKTKEQLLQQVC